MKKIIIIGIVIFLGLSCEDRTPQPVLMPLWLESRMVELEQQEGGCLGCRITRYTYSNEFFYWVVCNTSSCDDCEIYYYNGDPVDWEVTDKVDFKANIQRPEIIWECGDEINAE